MKYSTLFLGLLFLVSFSTELFAQTQRGYVKTLGRPGKKGMALNAVSVRVKGEHNTELSRADGTFGLLMKGKKNGDAYSLQQVRKTGYELNNN